MAPRGRCASPLVTSSLPSRRPATPTAPLGGRRTASSNHVALPQGVKDVGTLGSASPGGPQEDGWS
eukprot:12984766-Alexandrium_andersonii.AAC.1